MGVKQELAAMFCDYFTREHQRIGKVPLDRNCVVSGLTHLLPETANDDNVRLVAKAHRNKDGVKTSAFMQGLRKQGFSVQVGLSKVNGWFLELCSCGFRVL